MFCAQKGTEMVECPYNKTHIMLRKRLQSHIIKCRLRHPNVELQTCPFNQMHLISEPEFVNHVTNCPDRKSLTQYKYRNVEVEEEVEEVIRIKPIVSDENWDDAATEAYDPKKYVESAKVLRKPHFLMTPSERKDFYKKERKRLRNDSDDSSDEQTKAKSIDANIVAIYKFDSDISDYTSIKHVKSSEYFKKTKHGREDLKSQLDLPSARLRSRSRSQSPPYSTSRNEGIYNGYRTRRNRIGRGSHRNAARENPQTNYSDETNYSRNSSHVSNFIQYEDRTPSPPPPPPRTPSPPPPPSWF